MGIGNSLVFVDHIPHGQGMPLVSAEDYGFFQRIDVVKNCPGNEFSPLVGNNFFIKIIGFVDILV